ncbi:MAG: response regulator transcription factor [Acetobacter sp.]
MNNATLIRVAMLEDDPTFRNAIIARILAEDDMELHVVATNRREGLSMLKGPSATVLLADISLPDGSGLDIIRASAQYWPTCAVLVSTTFGDEATVMDAIASGAAGYLIKDGDYPQQIENIRCVCQGGSPISPMIARNILSRFRQHLPSPEDAGRTALSERERQVLQKVSQGFNAPEIASQLAVSTHTVRTHVRRIYHKLAVSTRIEAVTMAQRLGWLDN